MSAPPSNTELARYQLLLAAEARKKAREEEIAREAEILAEEMKRIDDEESAERERVRLEEARQREQETLAAQQQQRRVVRVGKRKAVGETPAAGGSVRDFFCPKLVLLN
jgi:hypothetical protein